MVVEWLLLAVPWVCLQFVIMVFPDHTHCLFYFILFLAVNSMHINMKKDKAFFFIS